MKISRRVVYLSRKDNLETEKFLRYMRGILRVPHRIELEYSIGSIVSPGWGDILHETNVSSIDEYDDNVLFVNPGPTIKRLLKVPDFPELFRHPSYAATKLIIGDVIVLREELIPLISRFFNFESDKEFKPFDSKYRDIKICVNVSRSEKKTSETER